MRKTRHIIFFGLIVVTLACQMFNSQEEIAVAPQPQGQTIIITEIVIPTNTPSLTSRQVITPAEISPKATEETLPLSNVLDLPGVITIPIEQMSPQIPWLPLDPKNVPAAEYYVFNTQKPPFNNLFVRQAFASAVDRLAVVDVAESTVFTGKRKAATTLTPPQVLGANLYNIIGRNLNAPLAQDLLAQAGYPQGKDFPKVTLVVNLPDGNRKSAQAQVAETIVADWRRWLKVTVEIKYIEDWEEYLDYIATNTPQLYRMGWQADVNDPDNFLSLFTTGTAHNRGRFSDVDFDHLVADGAALASNPAARQLAYIEAERILCETKVGIIPLLHYFTAQK